MNWHHMVAALGVLCIILGAFMLHPGLGFVTAGTSALLYAFNREDKGGGQA